MSWTRRKDGIPQITGTEEERRVEREKFCDDLNQIVNQLCELVDINLLAKLDYGEITLEEVEASRWQRFSNWANFDDLVVINEDLLNLEAVVRDLQDLKMGMVIEGLAKLNDRERKKNE